MEPLGSFPAFYGKRRFITALTRARPIPTLCRLHTFHVPTHTHIPPLMSFIQTTCPSPRLNGEGLFAPSRTSNLEDYPFSFARGCLRNIFGVPSPIAGGRPSIRKLRTRRALVTRDTPNGITIRKQNPHLSKQIIGQQP
jgi:hypothetical protein